MHIIHCTKTEGSATKELYGRYHKLVDRQL